MEVNLTWIVGHDATSAIVHINHWSNIDAPRYLGIKPALTNNYVVLDPTYVVNDGRAWCQLIF